MVCGVGVEAEEGRRQEGDGEERWKASLGLGLACPKDLPSVKDRGRRAAACCAVVPWVRNKDRITKGPE